jgi:proteic killer suppression protein
VLSTLEKSPEHKFALSFRLSGEATAQTGENMISIAIRDDVRFYSVDSTKGVPPDNVDKLRKILAFLDDMQEPEELRALPSWKVHTLTGDRKGTWSLSVTRNRRLTFRVDTAEHEICDLNLEDYH